MKSNHSEILHAAAPIETARLMLRRPQDDDTQDILEYGSDERVLEHLIWPGVATLDEAKASLYDYLMPNPGVFMIEVKDEQKCIGSFDLRMMPDHHKASFGFCINSKYWGRGYMTEALGAMLELCFDKLELNRVEASCFKGNEASGRVQEKCGMQLEGFSPQAQLVKGVFKDEYIYGITRQQWLALQG
ncbi:MAG: GNAT family N-acetyltransferase [Coriobacteriia bacterium]|nr:GNAT family N-acetyltransferase [Coriobacteriia bacterium]